MIVVYSKTHCVQCDATKRFLKKHNLPFEERQLADHPDVVEEAKASGILNAPICVTDEGIVWGGMNPDRLKQYRETEEYKKESRGGLDAMLSVS